MSASDYYGMTAAQREHGCDYAQAQRKLIEMDRDIPKLLATSAAKRFLSIEPMLGPIDLNLGYRNDIWREDSSGRPLPLRKIDLVIAGGESGPRARPSHPDWFRSLRDQSASAGVPFMFKQWGEWLPARKVGNDFEFCDQNITPHSGWLDKPMHDFGDGYVAFKVGKKAAGRLLDGVEHNGFCCRIQTGEAMSPIIKDILGQWRHRESGRIYTVEGIANINAKREGWAQTVVYTDDRGELWARPVSEWAAKFERVKP